MAIKKTIVIGEKKNALAIDQTDLKVSKDEKVIKKSATKKKTTNTEKEKRNSGVEKKKTESFRTFQKDGKTLVIVESPAKSNTIEKFLGPQYIVKASMGHLRDLPKMQLGINIEDGFIPKYNNLPTRKKLIDELKEIADSSSAILLATDPDREGEAISWHLAHILNMDDKTNCRITFNEITNTAVHKALEEARPIDMHMVDAQQARRMLDRIVGYKLSPLLWKKVCKGLSAGRVQSVAVRLICEREREIQAFIPEEYWSIEGVYTTIDEEGLRKSKKIKGKDIDEAFQFPAQLTHVKGKKVEIPNKELALRYAEDLQGCDCLVSAVEKRKRSRKAPAPFTTSTLQQEGVRKLGFGAKRIMMIAQHLYEGKEVGGFGHVGLITYMRTDSTRISKEMQSLTKDYILTKYGKEYYPSKPNVYGSKESSQDAHEAIRPTSLELPPQLVAQFLTKDELKLYTLIWNRYMASQMAPQQSETISVTLTSGDYTLKATGSTVLFKGFTEVYEETKKDETALPALEEGQVVHNLSIEPTQHFTQPPARYSEASLIKVLEEKGIGRPSTYAPTIDTIVSRNYVERQDKQFVPTELGFVVIDFLTTHFGQFINTEFTAHLEEELDDIAQGKEQYVDVLQEFYDVFSKELAEASEVDKVEVAAEASGETCELCGHDMVYKFGRFGRFLACSNFPDCKNTKPIIVSVGVHCPLCEAGEIVERKSKRGRTFYGCSAYPSCGFTAWDKPVDEKCGTCGSIMVEKTYKNGTTKRFCSNEECESRPKRKKRVPKENKEVEKK